MSVIAGLLTLAVVVTGWALIERRKWKLRATVLRDYARHDAWRCEYPDRYPQTDDCPCGLLSALAEVGLDPEPWRLRA